mgnify:CR=1 FL=1
MAEASTKNFTRKDFMTPLAVAKTLGHDVDTVAKTMQAQFRKGTKIIVGPRNHRAPMVYKIATIGGSVKNTISTPLRLHPLGLEKFKEILDKGNEK